MPDAAIWTSNDFRSWRQRLGWTQARAAEELRLHPQTVKHVESGRNPVSPIVQRLAEALESSAAGGRPTSPAPASGISGADSRALMSVRRYARAALAISDAVRADVDSADAVAALDAAADEVDAALADTAVGEQVRIAALFERRLAESVVALYLELQTTKAGSIFALGADVRNGALGLISGTLLAGGPGGPSLNSGPAILQLRPGAQPYRLKPGDKLVRVEGLPMDAERPAPTPERASILGKLTGRNRRTP